MALQEAHHRPYSLLHSEMSKNFARADQSAHAVLTSSEKSVWTQLHFPSFQAFSLRLSNSLENGSHPISLRFCVLRASNAFNIHQIDLIDPANLLSQALLHRTRASSTAQISSVLTASCAYDHSQVRAIRNALAPRLYPRQQRARSGNTPGDCAAGYRDWRAVAQERSRCCGHDSGRRR